MKTSAGKLLAIFATMLVSVAVTGLAQNIASQTGTVSRNTDHLTLLPGPGLLSPARGAGVPAPIATANSAQLRFTPNADRSNLAAPPALLKRTGPGTLTLSSDPSAIPPVSTLRKGGAPPSPDALRFGSTLEKIPASLRLQSPTTLRRD